jgi:TolA-binding protein
LDDAKQARDRLQGFLRVYPQSSWADDALMDLAALDAADSADQNLRSAIARYEYLLANYPSGNRADEALLELGNAYVRIEEWARAEKVFYQLLSRARTDEQEVRARLLIAALFSADANPAQDLPRALTEYEQFILAKFPKSRQLPAAYFGHAEVRRKLRDYEKAIASYQNVVKQWPHHSLAPLAQSLIAFCHEQESQFVASRKELETVKSLDPAGDLDSALSIRSAAIDEKERIQVVSANTQRSSETLTEFSGNVSIFYAGVQIQAERARYDSEASVVTVDGPAIVQVAGRTVSAQGPLRLDPEFQVIELRNDAQVQPATSLPRCSDEWLHLHLRTGKLTCKQ